MKPDNFERWAEQKGPPWDADLAMIAWTLHEMPAELREAYLLAKQDRARYADIARVSGIAEDVARRRVIEAANMVSNGKRALRYRFDPWLRTADERAPQPVDADIERAVDCMAGALSDEASARHLQRMGTDGDYFDKVATVGGMWRVAEDFRDLLSRIDEDKPPRPAVSRALNRAKRRVLESIRRFAGNSGASAAEPEPTPRDCATLLRFAFAGDKRMTMKLLLMLASAECSASEQAARRWIESLQFLRDTHQLTPDQTNPLIRQVIQAALVSPELEARDKRLVEVEARIHAIQDEHGLEEGTDFTGRKEVPLEWIALQREWKERAEAVEREFVESVGE
jgi:hypothetical protein